MPTFRCAAREVRSVKCYVKAASEAEAREKFRRGEWDECEDDDAETESVDCDLDTVERDTGLPAYARPDHEDDE